MDGSVTIGIKHRIKSSYALDKPPCVYFHSEPQKIHYIVFSKSVSKIITFFLEDEDGNFADVNIEMPSFTLLITET